MLPLEGGARLGEDGAAVLCRRAFGKFRDEKMKNGRHLVPDDVGDRFVAVGNVFQVTGVDGGNDGFFAGYLNAEGGVGEEDDD